MMPASEAPPKRRRLDYNAIDGVVDVDLTNLHATVADVDATIDAIIALADRQAKPPYVLVCWSGAVLEGDAARRYDARIGDLAQHVRAVVRYQFTDPMTRVHVRTETIKRRLQNARALIYESRQEALAAIRAGIVEEQLRGR